ncbi:von Willebrand factor type A domain-containing protein [Diaporthe sp. PMI_573]|nr:von Willebrand factor type A domain-containing protein [Diaporthaceae sp. PMI_573]
MTRSLPRLPSGVYFSLLGDSATHEAHDVQEYPTFPSFRGVEGGQDSGSEFVTPSKPQLCLPLVSVSVDMQVDHSIAKTTVVQTFTNPGSSSIPEAWYSFPLYDGAVITAFRCEVGDDKVLEGKVKPTDEARQEFKRAIQKQEAAALVEELTPEVFQTSIGNIAPRTTITVEITYVEELLTDLGGDGIIVTIPISVAPRYGTPPAGYAESSAVTETGLSLVVSVASSGTARHIACRSGHSISVEYGRMNHEPEAASCEDLPAISSQPQFFFDPKHATVRLSNDNVAMDRDFVLFIPSPGESLPRSRALLARSSDLDHAAMMVTVRPSELFSDLRESMNEFDGEILFLADRSGSMRGEKIEELKNALLVFLKSLPAKCRFNLYSFGNSVSGLWPSSMPYNETTMQQALDHISTFEADFGGTEVLHALRKAVGDRRATEASSTQLILLTDGQIWKAEETIDFVRTTTSDAEGQVRFFALGIGNAVSHQLIQGIGLFGGGFGEVAAVDAAGRWKEAVIRILKGAIMPNSWSYSISLGDEWDKKRLDVDDFLPKHAERSTTKSPGRVAGALNPSFFQAPREIPILHHFGQQSVYFLLDNSSDKLPEHVTITASSQYTGTRKAILEVTRATVNNTTIQHLAAKAAVRDLESQDASEASSSDLIRRNAEHLGQKYSISSKWTSFVAVSHLQQSVDHEDVEVSMYKAPLAKLDPLTSSPRSGRGHKSKSWAFGAGPRMDPSFSSEQRFSMQAASGAFGARPAVNPSLGSGQRFTQAPGLQLSFSKLSQRVGRRRVSTRSTQPEPNRIPLTQKAARLSGTASSTKAPCETAMTGPWTFASECLPAMDHVDPVNLAPPADSPGVGAITWEEVVRYQRIDGLFDLEQSLAHRMAKHFCRGTQLALGSWVGNCLKDASADDTQGSGPVRLLVDTVMVLAYLRSHFHPQRALWELLVQKAEASLASRLERGQWDRPDGLSAMADSALAHAHYGRRSQDSGEVDWWKCGPGGGCCGVCAAQGDERLLSTGHDDELAACSLSGCDVSVSPWDKFWSHAIEQGHINSSCEAASERYKAAEERTEKDNGQEKKHGS